MFDDNMMRGDIRSHLDDLAARHPEFADHLQPWGGEMRSNTWGRKRRGSGSQADNGEGSKQQQQEQNQPQDTTEQEEKSEEPGPLRGRPRENIPQYGLRNTVPDMGQKQQQEGEEKEVRGQRSWSAPPDNRSQPQDKPQRFVSKIEITPVNPNSPPTGDAAKPPVAPKQPQQQHPQPQATTQQPSSKQSTVRHIPIFVEGRNEPVLPRNIEQEFTQTQATPPQQSQAPPPQQFTKPPQQPPQFTSHQQFQPQAPSATKKQPEAKQPEPTPNLRDPLVKVQLVQKEVDELKSKVEEYNGNSRTEKDYIYLDEMLTRNLIKLDDIETDGKENVRAARREAIRSIQRCISILEGKAPLPNTEQTPIEQTNDDQKMEVVLYTNPEESTTKEEKQENMDVQKEGTPKPTQETKEPSVEKQMEVEKPELNTVENKVTTEEQKETPMTT